MGRKWNAKSDRARNKQRARRTLRRKAANAPRHSDKKRGWVSPTESTRGLNTRTDEPTMTER